MAQHLAKVSPGGQEAVVLFLWVWVGSGLSYCQAQLLVGLGGVCCKASSPITPFLDLRQMFFPKFIGCLHAELGLQPLELVKMVKTIEQETNLGLTVSEMELCLLTRRNPPGTSVRSMCLCFVPIGGL